MHIFLLFWTICLGMQSPGHAAVKSLDFTIHEEYTSTRAMGMGNAFTAVADDHSSLFYNPATLAFRTNGHLRMFVRAGATPKSINLFKEIKNVGSLPEDEQTQGYSDMITSHYGDHFFYRVPTIGAVWVRPGWGLAFIPADMSLDASVHRQIGPMININLYLDSTLALGFAGKFGKDQFSWGATLKAIHRVYGGQAISAGEFADGSNEVLSTANANEGMTGDIDLATLWRPTISASSNWRFIKPSFSVVGRNLVDYGFKTNFHLIDKKSTEPPKLIRRFDVGSKWDLPKFWVLDPHFAADVRNIGHPNWTPRKGAHAGFELYWKMFNWWKGHWAGGLNQGYWTAGFGARLAWFQLDLCSWGEEVGTDSSPTEDRRYMVEMALDF